MVELELAEGQARDALQSSKYSFRVDDPGRIVEMVSESVDGVSEGEVEFVPEFTLHHSRWVEEISANDLGLPHINTTFGQPISVCDRDDRKYVPNTTSAPWKYVCRLLIRAQNGSRYVGTGFFIGRRCIITNGHVVYIHDAGGWAQEILVVPGQNGTHAPFGSQASRRFVTVKGWAERRFADYDYGAVFLPDDTLYNRVRGYFGFQILNSSMLLNTAGYPADKPDGTQWFNAGAITKLTDRRMFYMIDTNGGQSGSPVWVQRSSDRFAVGVHGYGGCPNAAIRTIRDVANNWNTWRNR